MPNPQGKNQYGPKLRPSDEQLKTSLLLYSRLGLTRQEKLKRLRCDHSYNIGKEKLRQLENEFKIRTVRKPGVPKELRIQAVLDMADMEKAKHRGPDFIKATLRQQYDIHVTRDLTTELMKANFPEGFVKRYPGNFKKTITRTQLHAPGPYYEVHCDGHDKLAEAGLKLNGVGLPIYGIRDQFSSAILHLQVVPNNRRAATIGHLYLDLLQNLGGFPLKVTTDMGSETGYMHDIQKSLRNAYLPDVDIEKYPPGAKIKSTSNIVIESLWSMLIPTTGKNLKEIILQGFEEGLFVVTNGIHRDLFNWLFPPLVQDELDKYKLYWNQHRIRFQKDKLLPSGRVPEDVIATAHEDGAINCLTPLNSDAIESLREELTFVEGEREKHFSWVSNDFRLLADTVYADLGKPKCTIDNCWEVFQRMSCVLENLLDYYD